MDYYYINEIVEMSSLRENLNLCSSPGTNKV